MRPDKILCFELFGDYAQFKKFFTNMSPLSFSIPPRTVLSGIIGAILGIDKQENPEHFSANSSFIALRIMNPVKKTKIAHNYLKTTSLKQVYDYDEHKPTNVEFLKDVRYRIYFSCVEQNIYLTLKSLMEAHHSVYTVCLGISGCLANYSYLGEYETSLLPPDKMVRINSVIPMASIANLTIEEPLNLQKVVIPSTMNNQREVTKYDEVLLELMGKPITVIPHDATYLVDGLQDIIHEF
ncbi:MAG: type I-B CRISPR-associated protein Cas5b [Candidatus Cloacimonetes bacterium]|nr:type I-B CRISPR-associated protein Cas5b [Candidatus Cloacimonadota bacterium]